jgi:hypothetical protein
MINALSVVLKSAKLELLRLFHSPILVILTITQAITFMLLVNFFGMTGAFAPTAVIDLDKTEYSANFIKSLEKAHHSFAIHLTDVNTAIKEFKKEKIVAFIQIPKGFSNFVKNGNNVSIFVAVNNIDTDMTADIERALPSAITRFGNSNKFNNIHVKTVERDLINKDTGFIQYMVVSAFILNAFIIAGILSATSIAIEFEKKTIKHIFLSPSKIVLTLIGKVVTIAILTSLLLLLTIPFVFKIYQIKPIDYPTVCLMIIISSITFSVLGIALGTGVKKSFPVVSLVFGLSLPIFINSGSYEPERFDGNLIWAMAHFNPVYYIVGILQKAVWGFKVTPEPIWVLYVAILGWIIFGSFLTWFFVNSAFKK